MEEKDVSDCFIENYGPGGADRKALEMGNTNAQVALGPLNDARRKLIKELLTLYPGSFRCYVLPFSPKQHMDLIDGKHLLIESEHDTNEVYKDAYVFENISKKSRQRAKAEFRAAQSQAVRVTLDNVDTV